MEILWPFWMPFVTGLVSCFSIMAILACVIDSKTEKKQIIEVHLKILDR